MNINVETNNSFLTSNQAKEFALKSGSANADKVASSAFSAEQMKKQQAEISVNVGSDPIKIEKQIEESKAQLEKAMAEIKEKTKDMNFSVDIRYDERINRTIAKIVDKETGSVIKEIPPEEIVKVAVMISELAEGIILDNQA